MCFVSTACPPCHSARDSPWERKYPNLRPHERTAAGRGAAALGGEEGRGPWRGRVVQLTLPARVARVRAPHGLPTSGPSTHSLTSPHPLKLSCKWTQPYTSSKNTVDQDGVPDLGPIFYLAGEVEAQSRKGPQRKHEPPCTWRYKVTLPPPQQANRARQGRSCARCLLLVPQTRVPTRTTETFLTHNAPLLLLVSGLPTDLAERLANTTPPTT